jgi:hypothetical protein
LRKFELIIGCRFIDHDRASLIAAQLRLDKATGNRRRTGVSEHIEIVLIPKEPHGLYTIYPGLFLFTTPARMIRPVMNLITKTTEYIGTFEQVYLGICITHDEFVPGVSQLIISNFDSLTLFCLSIQLIKNYHNIIFYLSQLI